MANAVTKREEYPRTWLRRTPLRNLRRELEDMVSNFFNDASEGWLAERMAPSLDLSETDNTVEVRMDIPGAKQSDFDIHIHGDMLTVSGKRSEEREEKGRTFHVIERSHGHFSRSVTLPCEVDEEKAEAEYRDGVLAIRIPKSAESKAHKIAVKGK